MNLPIDLQTTDKLNRCNFITIVFWILNPNNTRASIKFIFLNRARIKTFTLMTSDIEENLIEFQEQKSTGLTEKRQADCFRNIYLVQGVFILEIRVTQSRQRCFCFTIYQESDIMLLQFLRKVEQILIEIYLIQLKTRYKILS